MNIEVIRDAYKFMNFYREHIPNDEATWGVCQKRASEIVARYNSDFATEIFIACMHALEKESCNE